MTQNINPTDLQALDEAAASEALVAQAQREQEVDDFKWLMGHRQGRRIVWRLLGEAGVFRTSHRQVSTETHFLEGMRNMGLLLVNEIHGLCPERYHEMVKEHTDDVRRAKR